MLITANYVLQKIEKRADGAKLPAVSIIDIKHCQTKKEIAKSFSVIWLYAIKVAGKKEGYYPFPEQERICSIVECSDCVLFQLAVNVLLL
jgi:hypothetical protein